MQLNISRKDTHYEIIAVQTLCKYMKKNICAFHEIYFLSDMKFDTYGFKLLVIATNEL